MAARRRHSMVASKFEYRHRFWMIVLVYVAAYAFYNLDHLNILYALVPWNQGVHQKDMLVRFLYAAATLVAAVGAALLTWSTAYRPPSLSQDRTAFSIGGPFRYVRNPQYLAYFLLILALGTFRAASAFRSRCWSNRSCCYVSSGAKNFCPRFTRGLK